MLAQETIRKYHMGINRLGELREYFKEYPTYKLTKLRRMAI